MTRELCRQYYRDFEADPDICMDMARFEKYVYSDERADAYYEKQLKERRIFLAVLLDGRPVGELLLKDVDREKGECMLSIHLQNDRCKGRGIGTQAERLALKYAFYELGMAAVNADAVLKNRRSQHVLEKVGFRPVRQDGIFRFYRCEAADFAARA